MIRGKVLEMETHQGDIGRPRGVHSMWWQLHTCFAICAQAPFTSDRLTDCFAGTSMNATHSCPLKNTDMISSFSPLFEHQVKVFSFGKYLSKFQEMILPILFQTRL